MEKNKGWKELKESNDLPTEYSQRDFLRFYGARLRRFFGLVTASLIVLDIGFLTLKSPWLLIWLCVVLLVVFILFRLTGFDRAITSFIRQTPG